VASIEGDKFTSILLYQFILKKWVILDTVALHLKIGLERIITVSPGLRNINYLVDISLLNDVRTLKLKHSQVLTQGRSLVDISLLNDVRTLKLKHSQVLTQGRSLVDISLLNDVRTLKLKHSQVLTQG
jgi:hypothetical protein